MNEIKKMKYNRKCSLQNLCKVLKQSVQVLTVRLQSTIHVKIQDFVHYDEIIQIRYKCVLGLKSYLFYFYL